MPELTVPALSLVLLVGISGSGKSTFGRQHFRPTEVISSDFCRGLVADDENDQTATKPAFELLHYIALAREHDVLPVAIVLDLPPRLCAQRNAVRPDRSFGEHVVKRQHDQLRRSLRGLVREGFRTVHHLTSEDEIAEARSPGPALQRPARPGRTIRRGRGRARLPGRAGDVAR